MSKLDYVLALLVLLAVVEGRFVLPAEGGLAAVAVDIRHCVQSGKQDPLLGRPAHHVHDTVEEVGAALAALEGLGDELVMIGQVGAAVHARVGAVAGGQVRAKRLHRLAQG